MKVGSLFSGIGGLDLGLERAGATVVWQSEIDPYCCRVLSKHWPHVPNLGDITQIDWSTVEPVDVICGGYPCQPFSNNGLRRGGADERHLWPFMLDAIRALRPCAFGAPHTRAGNGRKRKRNKGATPPLRQAGPVDREPEGSGAANHWTALPAPVTLGMAHGVRSEMDRARLKAHGNAVVPQVAEWVGRRIMEAAA